MKLVIIILGMLATVAIVTTVPIEEIKVEESIFNATNMNEGNDIEDEFEGEPPAAFLEEMEKYMKEMEAMDKKGHNQRVYRSHLYISSGDTIALQSHARERWLSCSSYYRNSYCYGNSCPKRYMRDSDWTNCNGETFQIYRQGGSGNVLVGDMIGLYYPYYRGDWFSCWNSIFHYNCRRSSCPGSPSSTTGFSSSSKWGTCWGEVFQIYALYKNIGEVIRRTDEIMLYYPAERNWVSLHYDEDVTKRSCSRAANRPPTIDAYDNCWGEVFMIT